MDTLSYIGGLIGEHALYPLDFGDRRAARIRAKLEGVGEAPLQMLTSERFVFEQGPPEETLPVLACVYLASGADMPDALRALAIEACRNDPVSAPTTVWSSGRLGWPERRAYMDALASLIDRHVPGDRVTDFGQVGLMEHFARNAERSLPTLR